MRRSISAVALGGGLQEKLYAIGAAGFDAVELTEAEFAYSEMRPSQIRSLLDELGLEISLFHSLTDVEAIPEDQFRKVLERAERKCVLMAELGASLMRIPANCSASAIDDEALAAGQLARLAGLAAQHGIRVGYEPLATARYTKQAKDAWRLVQAAKSDNLGLILDSFEILVGGGDPGSIAGIPADRIFLVQLADAPALTADPQTLGLHFRGFPGQGALDITAFAAQVLHQGYQGTLSLEPRSDAIRAAPIRPVALDAFRSLAYLEECLVLKGIDVPGSEFATTGQSLDTAEESVCFIEFSIDPESQRALEHWLIALGFHFAGRHRSKEVCLYQHGEVLLVLNSGTDTFAHYYHHLHGTSVCAIGLSVSDPSQILNRANIYKYKQYVERMGAQEYMMPAVRAPDGSLIHLLGSEYDPHIDFIMGDGMGDETGRKEGLFRVDHLARAVPEDQFDSWVLFHRALLGLSADRSLDLADPHGVVHSRALHDARNRLRLPLTCSESSRTVVAQSLATFGGAGINQIAFETDDIFAAAQHMRDSGLVPLSIPANYYRDLIENRDVPAELVQRMQSMSILYDRDDKGGEFLHVYTGIFAQRFFFEVLQRINGYERYGECNASIRLAAQAKQQTRGV